MDSLALASIALIYVLLQALAIFRLSGLWRGAAALPAPLLCLVMGFAVFGGLLGVPGTDLLGLIAVPAGIAYLFALIALEQIARILPWVRT